MDIDIDIQDFIDSQDGLSEQDIAWLYQYQRYIFLKNGRSKKVKVKVGDIDAIYKEM